MSVGRRSTRATLAWTLATGGLALAVPAAQADVTINDVRVDETDAPATATFTITRVAPVLASAVTIAYGTVDAGATAPADYTTTRGQVSFPFSPLGEIQTRQVTVPVIGDDADEPDEAFRLVLAGTGVDDPFGVATIVDDDLPAAGSPPGTPAPAPGGGPASPPTPTAAPFGLGAPRLERPATVLVTAACPRSAITCSGTVSVRTRANARSKLPQLRKTRTLGKRTVRLAGGKGRTLRLKLRPTDLALLQRAGRMRVRATSRITDQAGRTTKKIVNGNLIARTAHSG